jgi:hypothetical protein
VVTLSVELELDAAPAPADAGSGFSRDWLTDRRARRPSGPGARDAYRDALYHRPNVRVLLELLALTPADDLLEVGCGGGALLQDALGTDCRDDELARLAPDASFADVRVERHDLGPAAREVDVPAETSRSWRAARAPVPARPQGLTAVTLGSWRRPSREARSSSSASTRSPTAGTASRG